MIEKRLCKLSKNEEFFSNIKEFYKNVLKKSNFKYNLSYRHFNTINQWSSRCAPVYTSVHENYFTVHRKICKI